MSGHEHDFPEHEAAPAEWRRAWYCCRMGKAIERAEARLKRLRDVEDE